MKRKFVKNPDYTPRGIRPSQEEQFYWYGQISQIDPEWKDIEQGRDMNEFHGSTFKTKENNRPFIYHYGCRPPEITTETNNEPGTIHDTLEAVMWAEAEQGVWELPPDHSLSQYKDYLFEVCSTGNIFTSIKKKQRGRRKKRKNKFNLTERIAYKVFKDFLLWRQSK